jgi:hypothetical protein
MYAAGPLKFFLTVKHRRVYCISSRRQCIAEYKAPLEGLFLPLFGA